MSVARQLNTDGFRVSLDLLGEEVHDIESAERATDEYLESLDRIAVEGLDANISIKPTQLGLAFDEGRARGSITRLATRALEVGTSVTLDMEDSRYTEATVRIYQEVQPALGNLGIAIQSYLHRTPRDLDAISPLGGHIRLCKGAYVEPADVALTDKSEVDSAYRKQLWQLMAFEQTMPAIATHDSDMIDLALEVARNRKGPFEFQMLYGVRVDLQRRLIEEGFPLRVYLPFGSQWYPYLTRRLAERPANALFFARAALSRS